MPPKAACVKQTQSRFAKQAWKSPEIHGKTAPEAIYKEMQRRTKDKAEEENLVKKKCAASALLQNREGQDISANATQDHQQKLLQEKSLCQSFRKEKEKILLI